MKKFQALGGALTLALAATFIVAPAAAKTHHHSTAAEKAQTADLNKQQLAIAQGQAPANQQAMNAGSAQPQTQNQPQQNTTEGAPADQTSNGSQQTPAASSGAPAAQQPSTPSNNQMPQGN